MAPTTPQKKPSKRIVTTTVLLNKEWNKQPRPSFKPPKSLRNAKTYQERMTILQNHPLQLEALYKLLMNNLNALQQDLNHLIYLWNIHYDQNLLMNFSTSYKNQSPCSKTSSTKTPEDIEEIINNLPPLDPLEMPTDWMNFLNPTDTETPTGMDVSGTNAPTT